MISIRTIRHSLHWIYFKTYCKLPVAPFQYPIRRLIARSRELSRPWDLYLKLSDRSEIWQTNLQQCCRLAFQISKRCDNLNYQSRRFETSRDLTIRRLIGYWNATLLPPKNICGLVYLISLQTKRLRHIKNKPKWFKCFAYINLFHRVD